MPSLFKDAFCDYARCTPGSYTREMLYRCLHPNATPFAGIINWLEPASMFHFLQELGETTRKDDFDDILHEYHYAMKLRGGFLENRLDIRLAAHLLARLHEEVRRHENQKL